MASPQIWDARFLVVLLIEITDTRPEIFNVSVFQSFFSPLGIAYNVSNAEYR